MFVEQLWKDKAVRLLSDLVAIPSVNPGEGEPGSCHLEEKLARCLQTYFETSRHPYQVEYTEVLPKRPNVVARLGDHPDKKTLMFETHLDTVDVTSMTIAPFQAEVKDGRLSGRGSCDAKGQLVAMILGVEMALEQCDGTLPINVLLAATCDEEHRHRGVDYLVDTRVQADGAVAGEPTEMKLVVATKGSIRFQITTSGKSAHSSKPQEGVNAVYIMADVIQTIARIAAPRIEEKTHPLCGTATVSVTVIRGGNQVNIIPDQCVVDVDRRLLPGESWTDAYEEIKAAVYGNVAEEYHPNIEFNVPYLIDPSLETDTQSPTVQAFQSVMRELGEDDTPIGVPFGTDASKIAKLQIPTIVFGPGSINQAHTADEYIEMDELLRAARVYRDVILHFHEFFGELKP